MWQAWCYHSISQHHSNFHTRWENKLHINSLQTNVTDIPVTTPLLINKQSPTHKALHLNLRNHLLPKNKTLQGKYADTVYSELSQLGKPNSDLEPQSYILVKTLFHGPQERWFTKEIVKTWHIHREVLCKGDTVFNLKAYILMQYLYLLWTTSTIMITTTGLTCHNLWVFVDFVYFTLNMPSDCFSVANRRRSLSRYCTRRETLCTSIVLAEFSGRQSMWAFTASKGINFHPSAVRFWTSSSTQMYACISYTIETES